MILFINFYLFLFFLHDVILYFWFRFGFWFFFGRSLLFNSLLFFNLFFFDFFFLFDFFLLFFLFYFFVASLYSDVSGAHSERSGACTRVFDRKRSRTSSSMQTFASR